MDSHQVTQFSVPGFILKLYEILDEHNFPKCRDVIRWNDDGLGFIVINQTQLEKNILGLYFKHNNYSSFLRQLNIYQFTKTRNYNNQNVFTHQDFQKGKKGDLCKLKRKGIGQNNSNRMLKNLKKIKSEQKEVNVRQRQQEYSNELYKELKTLRNIQTNLEDQLDYIGRQNQYIMNQHNQINLEIVETHKTMNSRIKNFGYLLECIIGSGQNEQGDSEGKTEQISKKVKLEEKGKQMNVSRGVQESVST